MEEKQIRFLKEQAQKTDNQSMSALLREFISEHMNPPRHSAKDPLFKIIGMGRGDGSAVAREHDRYLYGKRKR